MARAKRCSSSAGASSAVVSAASAVMSGLPERSFSTNSPYPLPSAFSNTFCGFPPVSISTVPLCMSTGTNSLLTPPLPSAKSRRTLNCCCHTSPRCCGSSCFTMSLPSFHSADTIGIPPHFTHVSLNCLMPHCGALLSRMSIRSSHVALP